MDRDPLHDSVLAEAEESMEASDASSDTPMTRAERADATPLPAGPGPFGPPVPTPALLFTASGPPAPLPYSQEVATQTTLRMLRTHGTASAGTSASGPQAPTAAHMGPLTGWQRDLALQIIERLHLTCPVYMHAPSLAEVWSWADVTVTLSPTTPTEMQENRRVDATDVGGHLWETWEHAEEGHDSDTGTMDPDPEVDPHLESAAGGATGLPGAAHADHDARAGALDYAHNSMADRDPSMPDAAPAPDMPSAGLDTAADEGLIYEQDGVVFDLGAAQDCLRATRETLNMFREDRVDRIGSRSRSRSRHATHDSDGRQGPHALQRRRPNHPTPNLPGWVCHLALRLAALANYAICLFFTGVFHVSKILWTAPGPLTTGPMVIHHRPPRLAPAEIQVWAPPAEAESLHSRWVLSGLKRSRRPAIRCTVVRSLPPADSRLRENVAVSQDFHLAHLPWARNTPPADDHPYRYAGG